MIAISIEFIDFPLLYLKFLLRDLRDVVVKIINQ